MGALAPEQIVASAIPGVSGYRLRFLASKPAAGVSARHFTEPVSAWAVQEAADIAVLLAEQERPVASASGVRGTCAFIHVLPGAAAPYEARQRVEAWAQEIAGPEDPLPVELLLQNERLIWRPGRVAFFGSAERLAEIIPGLLHFVFLESELEHLEHGISALWSPAEAHVPLVGKVDRRSLLRWAEVGTVTETVTRLRLRFARLEPVLDKVPSWLSGASRRLVSELIVQAAITDRFLAADDRIDSLQDLYELANERLSEYSYFRKEFWLEVGIVVLLLVELAQAVLGLG